MARWKVPDDVVPTNSEMAASGQYDKLRAAVVLAQAELTRMGLSHTTARERARKILARALS